MDVETNQSCMLKTNCTTFQLIQKRESETIYSLLFIVGKYLENEEASVFALVDSPFIRLNLLLYWDLIKGS